MSSTTSMKTLKATIEALEFYNIVDKYREEAVERVHVLPIPVTHLPWLRRVLTKGDNIVIRNMENVCAYHETAARRLGCNHEESKILQSRSACIKTFLNNLDFETIQVLSFIDDQIFNVDENSNISLNEEGMNSWAARLRVSKQNTSANCNSEEPNVKTSAEEEAKNGTPGTEHLGHPTNHAKKSEENAGTSPTVVLEAPKNALVDFAILEDVPNQNIQDCKAQMNCEEKIESEDTCEELATDRSLKNAPSFVDAGAEEDRTLASHCNEIQACGKFSAKRNFDDMFNEESEGKTPKADPEYEDITDDEDEEVIITEETEPDADPASVDAKPLQCDAQFHASAEKSNETEIEESSPKLEPVNEETSEKKYSRSDLEAFENVKALYYLAVAFPDQIPVSALNCDKLENVQTQEFLLGVRTAEEFLATASEEELSEHESAAIMIQNSSSQAEASTTQEDLESVSGIKEPFSEDSTLLEEEIAPFEKEARVAALAPLVEEASVTEVDAIAVGNAENNIEEEMEEIKTDKTPWWSVRTICGAVAAIGIPISILYPTFTAVVLYGMIQYARSRR